MGVVEEIAHRYNQSPRQFFKLVESALSASDFELVDSELRRVVALSQSDQGVQDALAGARRARGIRATKDANSHLRQELSRHGILGIHAVLAGLQNRVLRPGSTSSTDMLLANLMSDWTQEEERLNVELGARVFAHVASQREEYRTLLESIDRTAAASDDWRFQTIYGLLWPRGRVVRERALETYNPFAALPAGDRLIVTGAMPDRRPPVEINSAGWKPSAQRQLREYGSAQLSCATTDRASLQAAVLNLVAAPIEEGFLRVYPRLTGIKRLTSTFVATLSLPEMGR
jgi:hypothetical protein